MYTRGGNTGVRVTLTRVDRTNTVVLITESSWRRAVRLHPQEPGAAVEAASQSAVETGGCLFTSTLEGNICKTHSQKHPDWSLDLAKKKHKKKHQTLFPSEGVSRSGWRDVAASLTQWEHRRNKSVRLSWWRRRRSTHWSGKRESRCAAHGEKYWPLRSAHDKPAYWSIPCNQCDVITSKGAPRTLNIDSAVNVLLFRTISCVTPMVNIVQIYVTLQIGWLL